MKTKVDIAKKIGKGYATFWQSKARYKVVIGGRASKKSTTAAQWIIYHMMKYPLANALVVRRYFNTHKDSTYAQLKWAAYNLKVDHLFYFSKSPLEITYIPSGTKILFRGMDNPMSITSITVEKGHLCWCWLEEFFQIESEEDFNKLDMSIRGELPKGYFKQIIGTLNPWSETHWIKKRFFDVEDENTLTMRTTYLCNEFLGEDDLEIFDYLKKNYPRRYQVEGLGNWGMVSGLIYDNWEGMDFRIEEVLRDYPNGINVSGLDFGYNDPTAFICAYAIPKDKIIYIYDEIYRKGITNQDLASLIKHKCYHKQRIIADSAEPKSIEELKRAGIVRIKPAKKGKDSIMYGIQKLQQYKIIVHPKCENTLIELSNYTWDTKNDKELNKPIDEFNHLLDALRYACMSFETKGISIFK